MERNGVFTDEEVIGAIVSEYIQNCFARQLEKMLFVVFQNDNHHVWFKVCSDQEYKEMQDKEEYNILSVYDYDNIEDTLKVIMIDCCSDDSLDGEHLHLLGLAIMKEQARKVVEWML